MIRKNGIKPGKVNWRAHQGVFAVPVTPHFYYTYQWVRELRRNGTKIFTAVQFRIDDSQEVEFGRYNLEHVKMSAAESVRTFLEDANPHGFEVIIPRAILRKEIHRFFTPPQVVGWRYFPGSHGFKPCGCVVCQRGQMNNRKLRESWNYT